LVLAVLAHQTLPLLERMVATLFFRALPLLAVVVAVRVLLVFVTGVAAALVAVQPTKEIKELAVLLQAQRKVSQVAIQTVGLVAAAAAVGLVLSVKTDRDQKAVMAVMGWHQVLPVHLQLVLAAVAVVLLSLLTLWQLVVRAAVEMAK
jgi:hypothetical protein